MAGMIQRTSGLLLAMVLSISLAACGGSSSPFGEGDGGIDADGWDAGTDGDGQTDADLDGQGDDGGSGDADLEDGGLEDGDAGDGDAGDGGGEDGGLEDGDGGVETPRDPAEGGDHQVSTASHELQLTEDVVPRVAQLTLYLPDGPGPFPVIVFHHGFQLGTALYASLGQHLASWGYVVVLPQMPGGFIGGPNHRELKEYLILVLDWIEAHAGDTQSALAGKADASRLGLAGHSLGGKIAMLVASEDPRPAGVFLVDPVDAAGGPFTSPGEDYPSVTPELMPQVAIPGVYLGETTNGTCTGFGCQACAPLEDNFQQYFQYAESPALQVEVLGANHMSFLDDPDCGLTCSVCPKGTDDPATTRMLTRRYMTAFFNAVLKDDPAQRSYLLGDEMAADEAAGLVQSQSKNGFL